MKTVSVRELQSRIKECVEYSQRERVVITQHGKPSAVIIGIKGMDWESVVMETSAPFWKMIRKRRAQPSVSVKEARARLERHPLRSRQRKAGSGM